MMTCTLGAGNETLEFYCNPTPNSDVNFDKSLELGSSSSLPQPKVQHRFRAFLSTPITTDVIRLVMTSHVWATNYTFRVSFKKSTMTTMKQRKTATKMKIKMLKISGNKQVGWYLGDCKSYYVTMMMRTLMIFFLIFLLFSNDRHMTAAAATFCFLFFSKCSELSRYYRSARVSCCRRRYHRRSVGRW